MTRMNAALTVLIATISLALPLAQPAQADAIQATYSTTGTIGTSGVSGTPVFSFQGVTNGALTAGQPFDLGQFVISGSPSPDGTTYVNTPFSITFAVQSIDGVTQSPNRSPVTLEGWLNGTIPSNSTPNVHMYIDTMGFYPEQQPPFPSNIAPFQTGHYIDYLSILSGDDVYSPIKADLNLVHSAPEPSAIIGFGLVGLALIRHHRRRSRASG